MAAMAQRWRGHRVLAGRPSADLDEHPTDPFYTFTRAEVVVDGGVLVVVFLVLCLPFEEGEK